MAGIIVRIVMLGIKWAKAAGMSKAVSAELGERSQHGPLKVGEVAPDGDFTIDEEEQAFNTNITMAWFQMAISVLQLSVCAVRFNSYPLENGITIGFLSISIPLAFMGLSALNCPEAEYAVLTMQVYQCYFILRIAVTAINYYFTWVQRATFPDPEKHLIIATLVLVLIIVLQVLNTLLVLAVIRIMRKRRAEFEEREALAKPDEHTPLLAGEKEASYDSTA